MANENREFSQLKQTLNRDGNSEVLFFNTQDFPLLAARQRQT